MPTLVELLADNPVAKAEHDALVVESRTEGIKVSKEEISAIVAKVGPILASEAYSEQVKECGLKAVSGAGTLASFEAVVVMADQQIAETAAKLASGETNEQGETIASGGTPGTDTVAETEAKLKAKMERCGIPQATPGGDA